MAGAGYTEPRLTCRRCGGRILGPAIEPYCINCGHRPEGYASLLGSTDEEQAPVTQDLSHLPEARLMPSGPYDYIVASRLDGTREAFTLGPHARQDDHNYRRTKAT